MKLESRKAKIYPLLKLMSLSTLIVTGFYSIAAYAAADSTLSGILSKVTGAYTPLEKVITGTCVLAGVGFAVGSILKFKAHKDNPTQVPIGAAISLLALAICLMFLPYLIRGTGFQIFGEAPISVTGTTLDCVSTT
ncbi:MAG: hypothetical protein A2X77_01300 [Gammaproteobacteria bacterium GWE2_42_36]|nr:MAG: hypothetical protein A2X77_01300 [Gammaproteobacteria bacterium GWE2_42_36]HCU05466.1 type IV secretion protein IcmD [Coxiellaceae bacterium]